MKKTVFTIMMVFAAALLLSPASVFAQEQKPTDAVQAPETVVDTGRKENEERENEYKSLTFEDVSKMYWAVGKFTLDNNTAIDGYMAINECDLYNQYYTNEMEWSDVRKAARQSILLNQNEFPTRFYVDFDMALGKYDKTTKEFSLASDSAPDHLRNLMIEGGIPWAGKCAGKKKEAKDKGYPGYLAMIFDEPLTLYKFPLDQKTAEFYIDTIERYVDSLPPADRIRYIGKRPAFLRMKVRFTQFKEEKMESVSSNAAALTAHVLANLEKIEIYADKEMTQLLYEKSFRKTRRSSARRHQAEDVSGEAENSATEEVPTDDSVAGDSTTQEPEKSSEETPPSASE